MSDETYIVIFPEYEQLCEEIRRLKTEMSILVLELDELRLIVCPNIKTEYQLAFGALELRVFDAYCLYLRLRRMIEMIRARQNRKEPVDIKTIESALDHEFEKYLKRREKQLKDINEAIDRSNAPSLSDEEAKELKKLYRTAVKALHPDLHPDQMPEEAELFLKAVSAFEHGDLRLLGIICEMSAGDAPTFSDTETLEELRTQRDRLSENLDEVKADIEKVKKEYPYTLRHYIEDEEKMNELKNSLNQKLEEYKKANERMQKMIREMTANG